MQHLHLQLSSQPVTSVLEKVDEDQYRALKEAAGLVERVDRSFLAVAGADATDFLQSQVTNDVASLCSGEGCYSALLTRKGKIQADLTAHRRDDDFLIGTEPVALKTLLENLRMHSVGHTVEIQDLSDTLGVVTVHGPKSVEALNDALSERVDMPQAQYEHVPGRIAGKAVRVVSMRATAGFDLILAGDYLREVSTRLEEVGCVPASPEAAECIRIESGVPRYGIDMTSENFPAEAGIEGRAVNFEKGCYVGQEPVARMHYRGHPNRLLRGLVCDAPTGSGTRVIRNGGEVGAVSSVCISLRLGPIALAILRKEVNPGDEVLLGPAGKRAKVVTLPFPD